MANIKVSPEYKREALEIVWEWQKSQHTEGIGFGAVQPPVGVASDGKPVLFNVPDAALPLMTARGIPFEIDSN